MYAEVEKKKDNKQKAVANSISLKKSNLKQGFGIVDNQNNFQADIKKNVKNHNQIITQRKLGEMISCGPQAKSATSLPEVSNHEAIQRMVEQIPNSGIPLRWKSTEIEDRSFASREEAQTAEDDLLRRRASMTLFPMRFGSGAPYGFPDFPDLGTFSQEQMPQVQEQISPLYPMLHTLSPQNRSFNTLESPRAPTMYFQEQGRNLEGQPIRSSGRVRQEHPSGSAVYIDEFPRSHLFSKDPRILDIDHEYDLEDEMIEAVPLDKAREGMHHIEIHHNKPEHRSWEVAHASGGRLSTAPMTDMEVDEAILRTALSGIIEDRRKK